MEIAAKKQAQALPSGATLEADILSTELTDGDRVFKLLVQNFRLEPGTVVALSGPSGSGKTLVLELLGLLRKPDQPAKFHFSKTGEPKIDIAKLWNGSGRNLAPTRGRVFGFVPQSGGLLPFLTVAENIRLTQRIAGRYDDVWVGQLLHRLGIEAVQGLRPGALSIGQRQRTAIARALAHKPAFVFADEPTAALDPEASEVVMQLFLELASENGCGVFLSSHDLDLVLRHGIPRFSLQLHTTGRSVVSLLEGAP